VVRTVLNTLPDCAGNLAVDPLSGDLFLTDSCNGSDYTGGIYRVENPSSASPTLVTYATLPTGLVPGQIVFAPDGTIYVTAAAGSLNGPTSVDEIHGTNTTQPVPTPTEVVQYTSQLGYGLSVAASNGSGAATALYATDSEDLNGSNPGTGHVYEIDLTTSPPTVKTIVTPGPLPGDDFPQVTTGPDGCAYVNAVSFIERVGPGSCGQNGDVSSASGLSLGTPSIASPPTGSTVSITAVLHNVANPAGTPIRFLVIGANPQTGLVSAGSTGSATFTYTGVEPGTDRITAVVTDEGTTLTSNPVAFTWTAGSHVTFTSLDLSPEAGTAAETTTVTVSLTDVTAEPAAGVAGQPVSVTLAGERCTATTNSNGIGTCQLPVPATTGLDTITASFAGAPGLSASSDAEPFSVTAPTPSPPPPPVTSTPPATKVTSSVNGYWEVAADGGIFTFGTAGFYGSMGGKPLNAPIVGMAATPAGKGYWEVAADGGIFAFGTAPFYGSMGGKPLNKPIVGIAVNPNGKGYWEVAADGGIFAFGTAPFYGSMGGKPLNAPIVGMAATARGKGYWLVAADGGVFTFGDAQFHGSMGGKPLNAPVVGIAGTPDRGGYWLDAADGGVFTFGDAQFHGSMGGKPLNAPVVGMASTVSGKGYWLDAADGGLFSFGDAPYDGSMGGKPLNAPLTGMALSLAT
jgi:hypothetical protein